VETYGRDLLEEADKRGIKGAKEQVKRLRLLCWIGAKRDVNKKKCTNRNPDLSSRKR